MRTRFEKAYCALYSDEIATIAEFAEMAGIEDEDEAFRQLREYRERVLTGAVRDPMRSAAARLANCIRLLWR